MKTTKKSMMLSKSAVASLLQDAMSTNYLEAEQLNVQHEQALFDDMLLDAYKENELADLQIAARSEDFERKLAMYSNRERNNLIRARVHENATKFSKCVKVESQSYRIERSLESFKTTAEHAKQANVDVKRLQRHVKFLIKEQSNTCSLIYDAHDAKRFKFINK